MRNLHQLFDWQYIGQIIGGDFAKFCGLLRIYELYVLKIIKNFKIFLCSKHLFFLRSPSHRHVTAWKFYAVCPSSHLSFAQREPRHFDEIFRPYRAFPSLPWKSGFGGRQYSPHQPRRGATSAPVGRPALPRQAGGRLTLGCRFYTPYLWLYK